MYILYFMTKSCYTFLKWIDGGVVMIDLKNVGAKIKKYRLESNLTQNRVAEFLSMDQSMVAKMEKGERSISSDVLEQLASLFCCSIDSLISEDVEESRCFIAFRSNSLSSEDLKSLAVINRIVINQFEMDKLLKGEDNVR